jgi:arylsulfatase A-like enzyme
VSQSGERPNILVIVTDQEYAHQVRPQGASLPSRDRLRSRGVAFNNHQAATTVCTPSRSVMWTGQHTPHTGMFDNTNFAWIDDMRADPQTLPTVGHLLRDLGYYTAFKGKWHESGFPQGDTTGALEPTVSQTTSRQAKSWAHPWTASRRTRR